MRKQDSSKSAVRNLFLTIDTMLFSILLFLPLYRSLFLNRRKWFAALLILCFFIIVLLLRFKYASYRRNAEIRITERKQKTERLLFISDETLSGLFHKDHFILIRKERPERYDVIDAMRMGTDAIGVFGSSRPFLELVRTHAPSVEIFDTNAMLKKVYGETGETGEGLYGIGKRFSGLNKYLLIGLIFLAASFVLKTKIYFRALSSLCFILACISGFFHNRMKWYNLLIFLDNRVDR